MTKEKLQQIKNTIDLLRRLITLDIYYAVYDENCIVLYNYPEDGHKDGLFIGEKFNDPTGKLQEAIATGKCLHNFLPLEKFGFVMEGNIVPVFEDGKVSGAIASAYVPMNQQDHTVRAKTMQALYHLILSVDIKTNHCERLYYNYDSHHYPSEAQHFDTFCEKMLEYIHPLEQLEFKKFVSLSQLSKKLREKKSIVWEARICNTNREYRWKEMVFTRVEGYESAEEYTHFLCMIRDIHERKAKEVAVLEENRKLIEQLRLNNDALLEQSMTDELTQVYNRKGLRHFAAKLLEQAREKQQYIYTFVADLNGLKYINDNYGHDRGDSVIQIICALLRQVVPETAKIARTGGDEFTVIDIWDKDSTIPMKIEQEFQKKVQEFNNNSGLPYVADASYGWDFRPAVEVEILDECISSADQKMYQMKSRRKVPGNFSELAQNELARRFSSAKQKVMILSPDTSIREEIATMFDDSYVVSAAESPEEAMVQLEESRDVVLLFLDNNLWQSTGFEFMQELSDSIKEKVIMILLLQTEEPALIRRAFDMGVDDVLIQPYYTELNKCHMTHLFRMNIANRNLSRLLGGQEE